jgi:tetratricopeptide (TPR) repeat protein
LIVAGEPQSLDEHLECLPAALLEVLPSEPLAADLRRDRDGKSAAKLKVLAAILEVPFDTLRQRDTVRRQRRLALLSAASTFGFILMASLAAVALQQRDMARQQTLTARRTVEFVVSMFKVSDPSEQRGETITAREVLDRGAKLIQHELESEPAVKAELGLTLSEVYGALGLYRQSDRLIRDTMRLKHDQTSIHARQLAALGSSQFRLGAYNEAKLTLEEAKSAALAVGEEAKGLLPEILVNLGQVYSELGDAAAADREIRRALALDVARYGREHADVARDLEALGLNYYFDNDFEKARPLFQRALRIRLKTEGALSPSVSDNLTNLGNIAYREGKTEIAERYYRSRLEVDEKVLGKNHPDVAIRLISLGRIALEKREFDQAHQLLVRATKISMAEKGELHSDMAYLLSNLALAKGGLGQADDAESYMRRAVLAAQANDHVALAPNLTDLAAMKCRRGSETEGLALLKNAKPIMVQDYPDDPWRVSWWQNVMGECLLKRDPQAAALLIKGSTARLRERWQLDSYYGFESNRRLRLLERRGA